MTFLSYRTTEGNLRNIWWVVIFFLILAAFLVPLIVLSDVHSFEISFALQAVIILGTSGICQAIRRKPLHELIGKMDTRWWKELLIGVLLGSALMLLPAALLTGLGYVRWQLGAFSISTIASGIALFFAVAAAEELLFRGFIFQRLIQGFGAWPAQLIVAGLFLLTHIDNPGMTGITKQIASVNIFVASILFGLSYIKTKGLAMPFGLHFMANLIQGTVLGFGVSGSKDPSLFTPMFDDGPVWLTGGAFGLEASVLGLLTLIIFTILLYRSPAR